MDALSEVLGSVRLTNCSFYRSEVAAPWGISLFSRELVRFHYLLAGSCTLSVDGHSSDLLLSTGDLALLPRGDAHSIADQPGRQSQPIEQLQADAEREKETGFLRFPGTGPVSTIITGCFWFESGVRPPLLATLPPTIRITPSEGRAVPWLQRNLQFIEAEMSSQRPGAKLVLARLAEVIFVQSLRSYVENMAGESGGFLHALRDPPVCAALGFMHREPGADWTVASLATKAGLSRSVFAARFKQLVGESPLSYLTRLRMEMATSLIRSGATLSEIAARTGYSSEASFSHAFRQVLGIAPGAFRRSLSPCPKPLCSTPAT
jgi:AraC-like DNA-binding protein